MRAVVSRCVSARVLVSGETVGRLPEPGLLALIGISVDDDERAASEMARKIAGLRILESAGEGPAKEVSASDIGAPILLVSQFTLYGDTAKGRRPSWNRAAKGEQARPLFDALVAELTSRSLHVESGEFGANMAVESVNDGPFTVLVET